MITASPDAAMHRETSSTMADALRALRRTFTYVLLFSAAMNILSLMLPIYSLQVFDRVFTTRSYDTLIGLTAITLIAFAFYGVLHIIRSAVIARVVEWLDHHLAITLLGASIQAAAQNPQLSSGQQLRELGIIKGFIAGTAPMLADTPWAILFLAVIYMINPVLGFVALMGIVVFLLVALLNEYATRKPLLRANEKNIESMLAADMLSREAEAIHAMGMAKGTIASWRESYDKGLFWQDIAQGRSAILQGIMRSLRMILQVAVTGIGAYLVLQNQLTGGGLIAASILISRCLAPFENIVGVWRQFIQARDSYHRLSLMLRDGVSEIGTTALPVPKGKIDVENLYYAPPKKPPILRGISLQLLPGESLGIIGPSAAGKSTLAKALIGVIPPTHGNVRLDGADIYRWSREDVGQYVGYLPQQVELFPGTIKNNIARMRADIDDAEVIEAAQKALVHDLILQFPSGYDTHYMPHSGLLSPGQLQRIGLARALYAKPKFVVLDEPNNNLDGEGERALMQVLSHLKHAGITTVVVAHRPTILSTVDKIIVLRAGQIEAAGTRSEIMNRYAAIGDGKPKEITAEPPVMPEAANG
jgi:ATP-binding cassette, subfamily B, bacterial